MSPAANFAIATAIWGSTWLAITWQLGVVPPEVSVVYRFTLAGLLIAASCRMTGRSLAFSRRDHLWLAAWGATFFGLNYVAVYYAEQQVSSGLVAVVFATIAVPFALDRRATAALWAVEAAGVYWIGTRQRAQLVRGFALAIELGAGIVFAPADDILDVGIDCPVQLAETLHALALPERPQPFIRRRIEVLKLGNPRLVIEQDWQPLDVIDLEGGQNVIS